MDTGVNEILRQLGGTPDKNKTGVDQIVEILENGGGGGGAGLPSVDGSDNGKVLTVVSGSWAAANPSGGSAFNISITEDGDIWRMNKTFNEIKTAFLSGLNIIVRIPDDEGRTDGKYCAVTQITTNLDGGDPPVPATFYVYVATDDHFMLFATSTADGYPEYSWA